MEQNVFVHKNRISISGGRNGRKLQVLLWRTYETHFLASVRVLVLLNAARVNTGAVEHEKKKPVKIFVEIFSNTVFSRHSACSLRVTTNICFYVALLLNQCFNYLYSGHLQLISTKTFTCFYATADWIRMIKSRTLSWAWHVTRMGEKTDAHVVLLGKPEGRRPLGRPRHGWEENTKMDLKEVGLGSA